MTTLLETPTFLDLVESYSSTTGFDSNRVFAGEGIRVGRRRTDNPRYRQALLETVHLYQDVLGGSYLAMHRFQEAMTTSDFPLLFGDVLDRQLLAAYDEWPVAWQQIARRGTVRDFRKVKRFTMDGGGAVLDKVGQVQEYPAAGRVEGKYEYAAEKYGRRMPFSWEDFVNDDLDAFRESPNVLAAAARRTEERFATALYAGVSGPNTAFFTAGNGNIMTAKLSTGSLQEAFTKVSKQRDPDGNPIYIEMMHLVVPPALEVTANNIINAVDIEFTEVSGRVVRSNNWLKNRLRILVNPWLPILAATANGDTSWYLAADPGRGRPAMEVGFLRGNEQPATFVKTPNAMRVGGGLINPTEGDFDTDSIEYKVRHVVGGTLMDPKMAVASDGTTAAL
jgi:hypothetical protein